MNNHLLLIFIILIFIFGAFLYLNESQEEVYKNPNEIACTMEAKQCPDGSYVSRKGPNCEFEICPASKVTNQ
jgi:hypothetical protein